LLVIGWLVGTDSVDQRGAPRAAAGRSADAPLPLARTPIGPKLLVVPFRNLGNSHDLDYFAYGISEEIALSLMGFDVLVIMGRGADDPERAAAVPEPADVGYFLTGTVRNSPDRARITARLVAKDSGVQIWSRAFDESLDVKSLLSIQEQIARQVATTIAAPFGPIFNQEVARATRRPAEYLDTYDCVLKYRYYRRTLAPGDHAQTLACFEKSVQREPNLADAWGGLALMYLDEHMYGYTPRSGAPDALTRAEQAARKALDIESDNHLASFAIARVYFVRGDFDAFHRALDRFLSLTPVIPDELVTMASLSGVSGDWERAVPLLDRALEMSSGHRWGALSLGYGLYAVQRGDDEQAFALALEIDTPNWYAGQLFVAAAAGLVGRNDIAQRAAAKALELNPGSSVRDVFVKWHFNEALAGRLRDGLTAAGVASATRAD
jgi:TolB-like protein